MRRPSTRPTQDPVPAYPTREELPSETDSNRWLFSLWDGRYLIVASIVLFLALGAFYVWHATPVYQAEAMLQIQIKRPQSGDNLSKLEGLLPEPSAAQAEIEILTSSQVLGGAVSALDLDLVAKPKTLPIIGEPLLRRSPWKPSLELEKFQVPNALRGMAFLLTTLPDGAFSLGSEDGAIQARGRVGEPLELPSSAGPVLVQVRRIQGNPGQKFELSRKPLGTMIDSLRARLDVSEKGKLTNVLGLTFKDVSPAQSTLVMNEILRQYVQLYRKKRSEDATQILENLRTKMPGLQEKLQFSEGRLSGSKSRIATIDLGRAADALLQQSAAIKSQISNLRQRRNDLLRTYTEKADTVETVDRQIAQLQAEDARLEAKLQTLPGAQREEQSISRDVQVNTALYSNLMSNMQQLQIYSAGDPGNIVIIDSATADQSAIFPKKKMLMALFFFIGCLVGCGLSFLRSLLRRGVEDFRIIETELGLPVLETIPHSDIQKKHNPTRVQQKGAYLLVSANKEEPAVEGLRGLRTTLHILMKGEASRIILITGPSPSVGKSFISSNLAALIAQAGSRVLLIDGDLRRGCQHLKLGLGNRGQGFSEVLSGAQPWKSVVHTIPVGSKGGSSTAGSLDLITTGAIPSNPSELLLSSALADVLNEAASAYDYVIVDAPPLLAVTDTTIISSKVDAVLLVAKYGQHPLEELRACQSRLAKHGIPLTGCVFNDVAPTGLSNVFHPYRYAYQYQYKLGS